MKKLALVLALLSPGAALAESIPVSPGLPGWDHLTFDDYRPNVWRAENGAMVVETNGGSSVLHHRANADPAVTPMLKWRWRVDSGPPATDLTQKGGEDRAISITVGFAYDSANASFSESMKRVIVEQVAGADAPGRIIAFAWGDDDPAGTILPNAYSGASGRIVIQQPASAPTGAWVEESVDIDALYRRIWGVAPPRVTQIALSADSDDTGVQGKAMIADIRFETR